MDVVGRRRSRAAKCRNREWNGKRTEVGWEGDRVGQAVNEPCTSVIQNVKV